STTSSSPAAPAAAAEARLSEAVRQAEARARAEAAARVPVTPPESAVWMGRLMGELWGPYVAPMLLSENLVNWGDKVRRAAPPGWELELAEMNMGRQGPQMSNYQVLADPSSGRVTAVDCDMRMESNTLRAVVVGSGPVGRFTATISGVTMQGRMRLLPFPELRLMLFSFREPPDMDVKLSVKGPVIGERSIPTSSFAFLRAQLAAALRDSLVEPRRAAISLDPVPLVGQPVDTTVNIYVEAVSGLTSSRGAGAGPQQQQQPSITTSGAAAAASSAEAGGGAGGGGVRAAASQAAAAASEAVSGGAEAIAGLVSGVAGAEGGSRRLRRRRLQVIALNTDNKLQRATRPVFYTPAPPSSSAPSSPSSSPAAPPPGVAPVQQLLRLNVGHKDGIFKIMVRDVGRTPGATASETRGESASSPASSSSSASHSAAAGAGNSGGPLGAAGMGLGMGGISGVGGGGGELLGSVMVHVAAAKDGSTLMWAAREGGEPVVVRWRPADGPWRVTLPLECPAFGLPPPPPQSHGRDEPAAAYSSASTPPSGSLDESAAPASSHAAARTAAAGAQQAANNPAAAAAASAPASGGPSITLLLSADPWVYEDASPPGKLYDSPRSRSLVVQVVEARELACRDWAGTCDPYVRLSLDGRTYRTRTLYNCAAPIWQQTFVMPDTPSLLSKSLSLSVYDSGVSRDDPLGSASLNLNMASEHGLQDRWLPLQGVESGWLRVRVAAVPDAPDSAAVQRMVAALEGLTRGSSSPLLHVVVLGARALSPRPVGQLLGMRDAYCNILYGGARQVTHVVKQSQNPRWDFGALFVMPPATEDEEEQGVEEEEPSLDRQGVAGATNAAAAPAGLAAAASARASSSGASSIPASPAAAAPSTTSAGVSGLPSPLDILGSGPGGTSPSSQYPHQQQQQQQPHQAREHPDRHHHHQQHDHQHHQPSESQHPQQQQQPPQPSPGHHHHHSGHHHSTPIPPLVPYPPLPAEPPPAASFLHRNTPLPDRERLRRRRQQQLRRRQQQQASGEVLRIEVKDVDPVPPDDDLGYVEVAVRELLPEPGDSWQGWLPLRRGEGGELQLRISRLEPPPLIRGEGGLQPMPYNKQREATPQASSSSASGSLQQQGATLGSGGGSRSGISMGGSGRYSRSTSISTVSMEGGGAGASTVAAPQVQSVQLDSFLGQIRAANRGAAQVREDLRVRLGQEVIPKLQDWWGDALRRTSASWEPPSDQLSEWLRARGLAAWADGVSSLAGRPPQPGQQQQGGGQQDQRLLPARAQSA
ncbi:hypothetical protein Agub_g954, partial [Astrephomene gubernaculifera]